MSVERSQITTGLAKRLVAEEFPQWAHLDVRPVDHPGFDNVTFRLGEDMSVRLPSADVYVLQVEKEHRWLPYLADRLPLPIPTPLAKAGPSDSFPMPWSVYRWIPGAPATVDGVADLAVLAADLARFLAALHRIEPDDGPVAGAHSFHRGGPLSTYDEEARAAIASLDDEIDAYAAISVWEAALTAVWEGSPTWVHGDVVASNLLVVDGRLAAVIDFGCCAVGDPACDLTIAWTLFSGESRDVFRDLLSLDGCMWVRGRGWALWKALITHAETVRTGSENCDWQRFGWRVPARDLIEELVSGE